MVTTKKGETVSGEKAAEMCGLRMTFDHVETQTSKTTILHGTETKRMVQPNSSKRRKNTVLH